MTGTVELAVQRTVAILFGTLLLGSVLPAEETAVASTDWASIVGQARLAYQRSDYAVARDLAARALVSAEASSAPEIETASVLNIYGAALLGLNKTAEAKPLLDRALSIRRRLLTPPNTDLATSLINHAGLLLMTEEPALALAAASEAVAMFETLGETKGFDYGVALNDLALARSNAGDYAGAAVIYDHARQVLSAQAPMDFTRISRLLINEGIAVQRLGDLQRAASLYEKAVELARQAGRVDPMALPNALNALGDLRIQQGRFADAQGLVTGALSLANAVVPPDKTKSAIIEATLARVCQRRGELKVAESHYESALAALRTLQPMAPATYAAELNNYGLFLLDMKRLGPAEHAFDEAQRIFDSSLGAAHPNSIAVTVNRGTVAERRHQYSRAGELYRKAIDLDTEHFGRGHFRVALDLNSLGVFEHRCRHYTSAEPLLRESLSILRTAWGPDHPEVALVEANLGRALWMLKRGDDAGPLFADAIRILVRAYGSDNPRLLPLYEDYARVLSEGEHYADSENAKLAAMRIRVRNAIGKAESFY